MRLLAALVATAVLSTSCTDSESSSRGAPVAPSVALSVAPTVEPSVAPSGPSASSPAYPPLTTTSPSIGALPLVDPEDARVSTAVAAVRHLAGRIGPRAGTSSAYFRAARWVEAELSGLGWSVSRQRFATPGGISWGVPVQAGPSVNLVATQADLVPGEPWLLVGAHLDTVPQAPGAEDNASGIGVLLASAEALAGHRARLPVVLVAFGSEEPRGPSDADHHYGSRAYVESLSVEQRRSLRAMIALDRVGVGDVLPIGSVEDDDPGRGELERAARRLGVPVATESGQRSSDHWSFVRAGLPGVRLGSTPYPAYHSAADLPSVVDPAQLQRTLRTLVAWLGG